MPIPNYLDQNSVNLHIIETLGEIKADVAIVKTSQEVYSKGLDKVNIRVDGLELENRSMGKKVAYYSGIGVGIGGVLGAFGQGVLTKLGIHFWTK